MSKTPPKSNADEIENTLREISSALYDPKCRSEKEPDVGTSLQTAYDALVESVLRYDEFLRGGVGSKKFTPEERMECLRIAMNALYTVKLGIQATPNYLDKQWLGDAVLLISDAWQYLPTLPAQGSRNAAFWISQGDLNDAVRELKPFWQYYKPKFKTLITQLQLIRESYSAITENPAKSKAPLKVPTKVYWLPQKESIDLKIVTLEGEEISTSFPMVFRGKATEQGALLVYMLKCKRTVQLSNLIKALHPEKIGNPANLKLLPDQIKGCVERINKKLQVKLLRYTGAESNPQLAEVALTTSTIVERKEGSK